MAIQNINLGTYSNDGTGDDLRTAFEKVKANFIELYSISGGANVGASPPISGVEQGELWWSTVEGRLYIKYGTSWIDASPVDGFVEYDISAETTTGGAVLRLNGTDLSQDSVKFAAGANITVTRTDANTITLSIPGFTGNVVGDITGNSYGTHTGPVVGNVTGNVTGNLTGNTTGTHIGNVTGNLTGNTTGLHIGSVAGNVTGNITGNAGTVTNGVYTSSSITELSDVDTITAAPTVGQALIWNGTNWIPGSVSVESGNNNFNFGGFNKVFTDPISYLLDKTGIDMGTFASPAEQSVNLGTF
jgi:hypothetical protein